MPNVDPEFTELYEEIADCPNCALARTRTRTVPGSGPASAEIMFIGEAPGAREDEQGLPFVGPAGHFLDELLASVGLSRESVYICNVVKCRPQGNRDPEPAEIAACQPFLDRQIEILNPKVIVTLGRFSMARWFAGTTIGRVHGKAKRVDGRFVVPMYHPAAALHRGDLRSVIEADFALLPGLLSELPDEPPPVPAPSAVHAPPALAAAGEPAATEQARLL
jgi:DNA polymerase